MAVSNLTGYTWIGNSDIHNPKEAENITWNISGNFDFGGGGASGSFTLLNYVVMNIFQDRYLVELRYDNNMSLYSAGWNGPNPVTIVFTGGDVTNAILITWLEANGTLTPPVVTNGAMYLGTSSISKMYIGQTEVSKVYLGQDLVYEKSTTPSYNITVSYTNSTIKAIVCADDENGTNKALIAQPNTASYTFTIPQNKPYIMVTNDSAVNNSVNSISGATLITTWSGDWASGDFQYSYGAIIQITADNANISLRQTGF